jgi:hypothetical protein
MLMGTLSQAHLLNSQIHPETGVQTVPLARVVHIKLTLASKTTSNDAKSSDSVLVSEGSTDELAEGPAAFDVFDDGRILIADPLRKRLAVFDAHGAYERELKIGFAVDNLTIMPGGLIQVHDATLGESRVIDGEGNTRPQEKAIQPPASEAQLLTGSSGTVTRPSGGLLRVKFEKPGVRLVSIQGLATDQQGNSYIALEATKGGDVVDVSKYVQKYAADGKLIAEVVNIPLDYFVNPVNELRVRKGILYQLRPTVSEIQINEWDVN